jgi:Ulp1 family protease
MTSCLGDLSRQKLGYNILDCDLVVIPLNITKCHWVLAVVHLKGQCMTYMDSAKQDDKERGFMKNYVKWCGGRD